ncbi:MAG: succinate dehydrogenase, cytochrome b556 subunit [Chloroflexota bacterium]
MALPRNVGLQGLRYQGGVNQFSWRINRWSGIGIVTFVSLHMLASLSTQVYGSNPIADTVNSIYMSVWFQILIVFIVFFHALHGLRVIILDLWPRFLEYQRELTYAQLIIFIATFLMAAVIMLMAHFSAA